MSALLNQPRSCHSIARPHARSFPSTASSASEDHDDAQRARMCYQRSMSQMRNAFRITILVSAFLTLAYLGLNEVHTEIAAALVLIGSIGLISAAATIWTE